MAFQIPDDKLAEIRNKADIVEVISERVMLKKAGREYSGLCPFHTEKTPSFTVSPDKQMYYCFGCGAGGDIFSFIMKSDGMKFSEAVLFLARRYGIDIPTRQMNRSQRDAISKREKILALNRRVMDFYAASLTRGPGGNAALNYLKKRGISQKTIDGFKLGFAPDAWDRLSRFIARSDVPPELAQNAGLIVPRKTGKGHYDRFRNRIIFPIKDIGGQVIGFGGRVMDDSKPKYLNSPETPVYNKSKTLYGLDAARHKCRHASMVFIVEGYFDLLALHQHGIENTVATLGTALTVEHVRRIKGYAKKACLVFDADAAGIKAAQRSAPIFMGESMAASVMLLPEGDDPDSFVFKHGPEPFLSCAQKAEGIVEFLITRAIESRGNTIEGRIGVVADMAPVIGAMTDSVARSEYAGYLADRIGADPNAVFEKICESSGRVPQGRISKRGGYASGSNDPGAGQDSGGTRRIELMIIAMMIQRPASIPDIVKRDILGMFTDSRMKKIGNLIVKFPPSDQGDVSLLMNHLDDEEDQRFVASIAMGDVGVTGNAGAGDDDMCWKAGSCNGIIDQFMAAYSKRNNDLVTRIREAEANNDHELIMKLLAEKQEQMKIRARL